MSRVGAAGVRRVARHAARAAAATALVACGGAKPAAAPAPVAAAAPVRVSCTVATEVRDSIQLDQLVSAGFVSRVPLREIVTRCRSTGTCRDEATSTPNASVLRSDSYATSGCVVGVRRDGAVYSARVDTGATAMVTSAMLTGDSFAGPWRSHDRVFQIAKAGSNYRVRGTLRLGRAVAATEERGVPDGLTLRVAPASGKNAGCLLLLRAYPGTDLLAAWDNGKCGGMTDQGWRGVYKRDPVR